MKTRLQKITQGRLGKAMRHWHALHYPLEGDYLTHSGQVWGLHLPLKDDEGRHSLVVLGNFLGIITIL